MEALKTKIQEKLQIQDKQQELETKKEQVLLEAKGLIRTKLTEVLEGTEYKVLGKAHHPLNVVLDGQTGPFPTSELEIHLSQEGITGISQTPYSNDMSLLYMGMDVLKDEEVNGKIMTLKYLNRVNYYDQMDKVEAELYTIALDYLMNKALEEGEYTPYHANQFNRIKWTFSEGERGRTNLHYYQNSESPTHTKKYTMNQLKDVFKLEAQKLVRFTTMEVRG